jgi:hypothetical protein
VTQPEYASIELAPGTTECPSEIVSRIDQLLKDERRILFIAINGSGINVGKTYIKGLIHHYLHTKEIPCQITGATDWHLMEDRVTALQEFHSDQPLPWVIITEGFDQMAGHTPEQRHRLRTYISEGLRSESDGKLQGVDLWVSIYRDDKPFLADPVADVVVRNVGAKNKENLV